jgi:hypothetical protein
MKYFLLIFCLVLCSCLSEEETELENPLLPDSSSSIESVRFEPCSSDSSVEPDPLILECPPEDIAECPVPDELPDDWMQTTPDGGCASKVKTSKEEVLFGAQGGVRCVTTDRNFGVGSYPNDCVAGDKYGWNDYTNMKCSWLTATKVSDRVMHIWVDKNETGMERKLVIGAISLYCSGDVLITQSAE